MIKSEKKCIEIKGSTAVVLTDLTMLVKSMKKVISKEDIMEAVNLAFLSQKEVDEKLNDEIKKFINRCGSDSEVDEKIDSMIRKIIKDIKEI